jgi:integrase
MAARQRSPRSGNGTITVYHQARCASHEDAKCNCVPSFKAQVWSAKEGRKVRKHFATKAEAAMWLVDAKAQVNSGQLTAPSKVTFREARELWLAKARTGEIQTRSETTYKPSAIRTYEREWVNVLDELIGAWTLTEFTQDDLTRLVGRWRGEGASNSTVRNRVNAIRVIFRDRAYLTDCRFADPINKFKLPKSGRRERIADATEARELIEALPEAERALWGCAAYAGLRRGEIRALRWDDVDLAGGVIHVRRGWDDVAGPIAPKSEAGIRKVPLIGRLRDMLAEHKLMTGRADGLIFGRTTIDAFQTTTAANRARRAWKRENERRSEQGVRPLAPITLHELRHTYASLMIDAGLPMNNLSEYMGHSTPEFTMARYGHLLPHSMSEDAARFDAYLDRAETGSRIGAL